MNKSEDLREGQIIAKVRRIEVITDHNKYRHTSFKQAIPTGI